MGLAALGIFVFLLLFQRHKLRNRGDSLKIILAGIVIATHWVFFFQAIKVSNVSVGLTAAATGAFFGALLEPLFLRKRVSRYELLLGLAVVVGIYLIFQIDARYTDGIIYGLIAAFLSAVFSIINAQLVKKHSPMRISLLELFGGFLGLTLFVAVYPSAEWQVVSAPDDWIYLLILALLCTSYAFIESVAIMRVISPYSFLLTLNLEPVYGIVLALVIFGEDERMSPFFYLGAILIFTAIVVDTWLKRKQNAASQS